MEDLAVIPEDLQEQETLMSEISRRESIATVKQAFKGLQQFPAQPTEMTPREMLNDKEPSHNNNLLPYMPDAGV